LEEKMSEQRELRPCPFCGSLAESALYQDDRWIECPRCQQGISGDADCITAEALIDIWNTRPIEDALQARIAELELILAADKLIEDGWIGRIEAGDKRIAELEAENAKLRASAVMWHKYPDKKPWAGGEWLILLDGVEKIAVWTYGRFEIQSEEYPINNNLISHWRELPTPPEEQ
jgi:hypothetical protein